MNGYKIVLLKAILCFIGCRKVNGYAPEYVVLSNLKQKEMKKINLIFRIVLLFVLGSCSKNDPYPKYETTFSFEEREKNVIIDNSTHYVYLKGKVARLYSNMHNQKLTIIPELTAATKEQYHIADSLVLFFHKNYDRDSIKIDIFPEQIKRTITIAFMVENLVVDKDYSLYIDTPIINLIPSEISCYDEGNLMIN